MKKFRIAVDAMGGDHAPAIPVKGALEAARELGVKVLLVGREEDLRAELARHSTRDLDCELVPAADVIGMEEKPLSAIRRKRQSSIAVAVRLVRETGADGMISAGNTGAVMATSKIFLGTLTGVDRPALMAVIPNLRAVHPTLHSCPSAETLDLNGDPHHKKPLSRIQDSQRPRRDPNRNRMNPCIPASRFCE